MSDEAERPGTSRRDFLKAGVAGGVAAAGLTRGVRADAGDDPARAEGPAPDASDPIFFTSPQREALAVLADLVLPGAGVWGAVDYVERLLTCFDHDPPHLYGGMVGSRDEWLPLDRVRTHAWRLRLFGSGSEVHPNETVLGPLRGLRALMVEGAERSAARLADGDSPEWVWWRLPGEFRDAFTELVLEGSLGDPIYGGNRDAAGWRAFHFQGAMLGYGGNPPARHGEARSEEGDPGPDPLGPFTRIALWAMGFFSRRIA